MEVMGLRLAGSLLAVSHIVITCCSLQLLNVQLQAFAWDASFDHNYSNNVPVRRSAKMGSEGKQCGRNDVEAGVGWEDIGST